MLAIIIFLAVSAGCASVSDQFTKIVRFIDGEDRVEMEGSTAQVTDLVTKSAEVSSARLYADNTDKESQTTVRSATETVTDKPASTPAQPPVSDSKPLISPVDSAQKNTTAIETTKQKEASSKTTKVAAGKKTATSTQAITTLKAKEVEVASMSSKSDVKPVLTGALSGRVIMNMDLPNVEKGSNQSIVRLIPTFESVKSNTTDGGEAKSKNEKNVVIDMRNKTYQPQYISASKEDLVVFTNSDSISHNVFSRSGKNAFDLGTYAGGKKRGVKFKDSGIVKVYCNIHPDMATFVSVVDDGYSIVTDENGYFRFDDIPTGKYLVEAWNIRGSVNSTATVTKNNSRVELVITTLDPDFGDHKNKFGKSYSENPALFKDEFY